MSLPTDFGRHLNFSWPTSCREAGILLLVAVLATGGWWARNTDRLPLRADPAFYQLELEAPLLAIREALAFYDDGAHLFVDTRIGGSETIPGSLFIREATFDDDLLNNFDFMFAEDTLIIFGDGNLTATSNIAGRLKERGYQNVHILRGGLPAWIKGGGPTSSADREAGS